MAGTYKLILPRIDVAMESGRISEWVKKEGDRVSKDELVAIVETEKAAIEIRSEVDGVLVKILHNVGEEVNVGEPIAEIKTD
ncbi:Dihydrolipoyllysine-residue succinyltransferase component of 2-oxoglutarate dehydrogenase complex [archaeon HR01]|nr:Dihydrolipoyllysine-residue succinyltransferase component of 2-oxoglutarate dehydrogenase complex [archaeon HR01]